MTKTERVLRIYDRLLQGEIMNKRVEAERYKVDERTIQRDLSDIRHHLRSTALPEAELVFDRRKSVYLLKTR